MRSWHGNLSPFGAWRTSGSFYPTDLFAASEPGIWLDPSDLTTLFREFDGIRPVTTAGQSVGLVLDKSQNLTIGSERLTNGDFDAGAASWAVTGNDGTHIVTFAGGTCRFQSDTTTPVLTVTQSGVLTIGKTYLVTVVTSAWTSGSVKTDAFSSAIGLAYGVGTVTIRGRASSTAFSFTRNTSNVDLTIDSITVKEIAGNHAFQTTAASRPTYGVVPFGGRRNLLTYSEQLDNAAWTKNTATVSANAGTAPNGTSTADKIIPNAAATNGYASQSVTVAIVTHTVSFYAKAAEQSVLSLVSDLTGTFRALIFNLGTGVATTATGWAVSMTDVGDDWYRCVATATANTAAAKTFQIGNNSAGWTGDGTSGFLLWGAQVETGSSATAYQKVVSAFDVTEAGTVSLSYLSFDGVDDFLVTPTITPGTDKVQVFAGVRKLSDAAAGIVAELSAIYTGNTGVFALFAPTSPVGTLNYGWASKGTAGPLVAGTGFAAPRTDVLTGLGDIAADSAILRVNGAQAGSSASDQGTGNYLAYPIYIGRRGGTTLPLNGQIYGLITRFGANLNTGQITSAEHWMNAKTGAY